LGLPAIFSFAEYLPPMSAFFLGTVLGLSLTLSVGPGFMALFQTSLARGLTAGFVLATGMLLSDFTIVTLSYYGLAGLILKFDFRLMGMIAGLILMIMGCVTVLKKTMDYGELNISTPIKKRLPIVFVKGFMINIANPFSMVFWMGMVGLATKNWGTNNQHVFLFFTGVFTTAFTTDLLKCYLSGLLSKALATGAQSWINKALGIVFIGIGLFIILKVQP
jgi:threonine/homoserine/homoserine lactone efflux protein